MSDDKAIFDGLELVGVPAINFDRVVKIIFIREEGVLFFKEKGEGDKLFYYKAPKGGAMARFTEEEFLAIAKMYSFSGGLIAIEGLDDLCNLGIASRLDDPDDGLADDLAEARCGVVFETRE
jgi:hypothetical protein